ncbi:hypothetical protein Q4543_17750 [Salipiger sp. 1_MG-2023]|uniref:hypothetical protein n=1 Tax=Salipiger sp. 1_MG-2023 TaxID=3062665 RepID=UPI0026E3BB12|nr:hypothetical protein [Salipiger sp. 1_MG-2023]MDO6587360.1 hypothetical protein [Salipiger sp. 1_MG-2023]
MLYDKTGAAFDLDHERDGTAYVRPMVKVVDVDTGEEYGHEPAEYLVERRRCDLFDAPPVEALNADIAAKQAELAALQSQIAKTKRDAANETWRARHDLETAQRQLADWMKTHKVMIDLGKLLEGQTLYPLTVKEGSYHPGREVPSIPQMRNASYLRLSGGDWDTGKAWSCKRYSSDNYGCRFQFFDTEDERADAIASEFDRTCDAFRKSPAFSLDGKTYSTRLDFGTLTRWVETHAALTIPADILAMKAADDAAKVEARKAKLAAELAAIDNA